MNKEELSESPDSGIGPTSPSSSPEGPIIECEVAAPSGTQPGTPRRNFDRLGVGTAFGPDLRNYLWDLFQKKDLIEPEQTSDLFITARVNQRRGMITDRESFDRLLDWWSNGANDQPSEPAPVYATIPDPTSNNHAQIRDLVDRGHPRDAVFVAAGNEAAIPDHLPMRVKQVARPEGTLLTTNPDKANLFASVPSLTDQHMAQILGYPETKEQAIQYGNIHLEEQLAKRPEKSTFSLVRQVLRRRAIPILVLALTAVGIGYCTLQDWEQDVANPAAASSILIDCSPFYSLTGERMLDFHQYDNSLALRSLRHGLDPNQDMYDSGEVVETEGSFSTDERNMSVTVTIDGTTTEYLVLKNLRSGSCVLAHGPLKNADLTTSWYANVRPDPDAEEDSHDPDDDIPAQ